MERPQKDEVQPDDDRPQNDETEIMNPCPKTTHKAPNWPQYPVKCSARRLPNSGVVLVLDKWLLINHFQMEQGSATPVAEPSASKVWVNKLPLEVGTTQLEFKTLLEEAATHALVRCSENPISCGYHRRTACAPKRRSGKVRSWYARPNRRRGRLDLPYPPHRQSTTVHYSLPSLLHPPSDPPIETVSIFCEPASIAFMRRTDQKSLVEASQLGYCTLILGNRRIYFVGPGKDTTLQVQYLAKACALQKFHGFGRTFAAAAMRHNLSRAVEFAGAFGEITERNQMAAKIANLIFVRFAHVEEVQIVAAVETGLQFARRDLRHRSLRGRRFFSTHAAEFRIVDQLGEGRMRAAHRAVQILAQFQFPETHGQRIE